MSVKSMSWQGPTGSSVAFPRGELITQDVSDTHRREVFFHNPAVLLAPTIRARLLLLALRRLGRRSRRHLPRSVPLALFAAILICLRLAAQQRKRLKKTPGRAADRPPAHLSVPLCPQRFKSHSFPPRWPPRGAEESRGRNLPTHQLIPSPRRIPLQPTPMFGIAGPVSCKGEGRCGDDRSDEDAGDSRGCTVTLDYHGRSFCSALERADSTRFPFAGILNRNTGDQGYRCDSSTTWLARTSKIDRQAG